MLRNCRWLFGAALMALATMCFAEPSTMLVVKGNIKVFSDEKAKEYRFTEEQLLKLKQRSIVTKTTWTPTSTFSGPEIADILNIVGAQGSKVEAITYDDYKVTIPIEDFAKYKAIMARFMNGKPLERRNYGPLWIMYPVSDYPELQTVKSDAKLVWQIRQLVVR
ncbi:molybdopterin-dependent oxidoreductase [Chromobacterium haemolyticum]|uniref:molybdopterin-dependent oxidoreductase n=1 Tax=Chromobacterium haemolyticum TaxID=394935 RepID=UPI00244BA762|nr:molybdopterin-dependent oxidoreductase [Chromobacterium haemolyticum]MDH0342138.1 molybdopterin-dependent oxidoreductase [Chromobacterium haemolyticum]